MQSAGCFASDNAALHGVVMSSVKVSALATSQPSGNKSVTLGKE